MDIRWWLLLSLLSFFLADVHDSGVASNFYSSVNITWGRDHAKIYNGGKLLTLSLDNSSGSAFASHDEYLFGKIDMQIKLVSGNSAGTVTALYLSSLGRLHDEVDFEFLGNVSGQPYTVHTNVYTGGKGDREMQFHVWFDPTSNFHTYTLLWNPQRILWMIDGIPIRDFKNSNASFPIDKPMKLYSSIWNAENWATQGGRIKTNWSLAPFTAFYRGFNADACVVRSGVSHCTGFTWFNQQLGPEEYGKMQRVQNNYMIYDYCKDYNRFPHGVPLECNHH